ncbi:MAG: hypothetical protein MUE44_01880 [Oscillatoriaceae cyanobacterium Prado104]|nr:hypothetical protein [Oscillatoriaceae cyanobacterium Prado104]
MLILPCFSIARFPKIRYPLLRSPPKLNGIPCRGEAFGRQSRMQNKQFHVQMLRPALTKKVRSQFRPALTKESRRDRTFYRSEICGDRTSIIAKYLVIVTYLWGLGEAFGY